MTAYERLLEAARERYGIAATPYLSDVVSLLSSWGATTLDLDRYREDLVDEFVDPRLAAVAMTLWAPQLLRERASEEERANFDSDETEKFDPFEYGAENQEWTTYSHEVEAIERLHIILESSELDAERPGNFRVYGAGQWLRESLWAATGVVPRDPGTPVDDASLFKSAFVFAGRAPFTAQPLTERA